jgi:hypothetical protein
MWTLGAFRPNAQLFELFGNWFYRHPEMSSFRPSATKTLEEPSAWEAALMSMSEVHKCHVKLSGAALPNKHSVCELTGGCCRG